MVRCCGEDDGQKSGVVAGIRIHQFGKIKVEIAPACNAIKNKS